MISFTKNAGLIALAALMLAACSQGQTDQSADTAAQPETPRYQIRSYGRSTVADTNGTITATRTGDGDQGVSIMQEPVLVQFTVTEPDAQVRVFQGGNVIDIPAAESYSIMIGPGGGGAIRVSSPTAAAINVRVVSVTPCAELGEGACTPPGGAQ